MEEEILTVAETPTITKVNGVASVSVTAGNIYIFTFDSNVRYADILNLTSDTIAVSNNEDLENDVLTLGQKMAYNKLPVSQSERRIVIKPTSSGILSVVGGA